MTVRSIVAAILCIVVGGLGGCSTNGDGPEQEQKPPLFTRLASDSTGVTFANTLSENPTPHRTELLYEYFSNGAGVAVGDVNGDGRDDLYFTANMGYNALYLNQGGMRFREVSRSAGVQGRKNTWNTGVSMADVNGDGRLDIYVCYSGELPLDRRVDELYINQGPDANGVPQFEERAAEYGLANPHSSNQAYFFDSDRDGDLDLYLQTHNVKTIPRGTSREIQQQLTETDSVNGNHFYENRGGTFVDVTEEVGIQNSPLTYGLGAGMSDINKDGWPDLYVGNDYSPPDYLYLNDGDGTFTNTIRRSMGHISRASMGVDVADINNDTRSDVVVLDMIAEGNRRQKLLHIPNDRNTFDNNVNAGFHHQYTINTLQLNNGNGTFSEIAQLAGVSNTDWSWAPLVADYDNDGWKDLFVTNGILHDITNRDFIQFRRNLLRKRNYDLKPEDVAILMKNMPSEKVENYAFENMGGFQFTDVSAEWGLDEAVYSNGAAYGDLDGDGDLDLVTNNINETASIYENRASRLRNHHYLEVQLQGEGENTYGIGAKVTLFADGSKKYLEQYPTRGYLSTVSPVLHFGLGEHRTVDSMRVGWPDGRTQTRTRVPVDQTVTFRQEEASAPSARPPSQRPLFRKTASSIDFRHRMEGPVDDFRRQPLMVNAKSFAGPALAATDVNGDGRKDVFVGGGNGQLSRLYVQRPDGTFEGPRQDLFSAARASNDVAALFFDANGDGHPDLYVASGGYWSYSAGASALQDRLYINDGTGRFRDATGELPQMHTSTGAVAAGDFNGDGAVDLFVGGRVVPGCYPESPRSYVLVNEGDGTFTDRTKEIAPDLQRIGMVTDAEWHDLDGEGTDELIVGGEWMPLSVFERDGDVLRDRTDVYFERDHRGFWYSVEVFALDDSGKIGVLAGNLGLNSQLRADDREPLELFYDDFDRDGRIDPLLSLYIDGKRYPHPLLDRLRSTIPPIGARFSSYEAYAKATLDEVLTDQERRQARSLRVDDLKTRLFVMGESGLFQKQTLPVQVQYSPVFEIEPLDVDDDGVKDLLLAGNMNETRIRFPKYDASYGMLLHGRGGGEMEYVPQRRSGFAVTGDVRGLVRVQDRVLFGVNRDSIQVYQPIEKAYPLVSRGKGSSNP